MSICVDGSSLTPTRMPSAMLKTTVVPMKNMVSAVERNMVSLLSIYIFFLLTFQLSAKNFALLVYRKISVFVAHDDEDLQRADDLKELDENKYDCVRGCSPEDPL